MAEFARLEHRPAEGSGCVAPIAGVFGWAVNDWHCYSAALSREMMLDVSLQGA